MSDQSTGGALVELLTTPPPEAVVARMTAIEGVQIVPTMLATQQGPDRHHGPEAAGAVLILQATFVDAAGATEFWDTAAALMEKLATAPGFIRRFNFRDGPHYTLIALWRTTADAHAFFSTAEHQAAMRDLFRNRWQYSHFAALWEMTTPRQRVIFCQQCDGVTPAPDRYCVGCGMELFDPFRSVSHVDH
jgi:heme-degrading monooxygenase HmoA